MRYISLPFLVWSSESMRMNQQQTDSLHIVVWCGIILIRILSEFQPRIGSDIAVKTVIIYRIAEWCRSCWPATTRLHNFTTRVHIRHLSKLNMKLTLLLLLDRKTDRRTFLNPESISWLKKSNLGLYYVRLPSFLCTCGGWHLERVSTKCQMWQCWNLFVCHLKIYTCTTQEHCRGDFHWKSVGHSGDFCGFG